MIYKFECKNQNSTSCEFEQIDEDYLSIVIKDEESFNQLFLDKKDVYHLIGALHLIQKEMK